MSEVVSLIGRVFGMLTVQSRHSENNKYGRALWLCLCECGNSTIVSGNNLLKKNTKSCGCAVIERTRRMGKLNTYPEAGVGWLIDTYRSNAQDKGLPFTLTFDEFKSITSSRCHYCGIAPYRVISSRKAGVPYLYNGIDRKDNNLGYIIENCLPACYPCNRAKNKSEYNEFMDWISRIAHFNASKFGLIPKE